MKRLPLIIALLISCSVLGQDDNAYTVTLLNTFLSADKTSYSAQSFDAFLKKLEKKQNTVKQQSDFVHYLFSKTHQQYLKKYEAYTPMSNLFKDGSYNCLTGTILYALILNHFQIPHQVIETNYHIFILAETQQGNILLEATDPINGFVTNPIDIESRITTYKANSVRATNSKANYYQFNFELFNPVTITELRGLLYYNMSVNAYNQQNMQESVEYLQKSHMLYSSSRIDEFSQILLLAVQQNKMEPNLRVEYLKTLLSIRRDLMPTVASLN